MERAARKMWRGHGSPVGAAVLRFLAVSVILASYAVLGHEAPQSEIDLGAPGHVRTGLAFGTDLHSLKHALEENAAIFHGNSSSEP